MLLVTGGAGFIGSNVVAALNEAGRHDIVVNDHLGTGKARSFRDLIVAMFRALGRPPQIEYVEMPASIRAQYQYFTEARVENLRRAGYNAGFTGLEDAVARYVTEFLDRPDRYR